MKQAVIIGSGLGGLSCATVLAREGFAVTVLEQGRQVGGCLQCFSRHGAKFETGMHFVGSARPGQTLHRLLTFLGVADEVALSPLSPQGYDVVSLGGEQYAFANGRNAFIDTLAAQFPKERAALERYFDLVERVASASALHSLQDVEREPAATAEYQLRSMDSVLAEITPNERLQNVLAGTLPLYAAERGRTPFATHAFIMDFYNQSAMRFVGGSDTLAQALVRQIESAGGRVLLRKKATQILCDSEKATAVACADGDTFPADLVVSAIHPTLTARLVQSPLLRPAYRQRMDRLRNTVGGFSLYLQFRPESVPYMNHNFYGYAGETPWGCETYDAQSWPKGYLYMHLCEQPRQQWATSGIVLSYMQWDDVAQWAETHVWRRGADYEDFKQRHAQRLLQALEKDFPGLSRNIAYMEASTPLTYRDYTGTLQGGMYGIAKDITLGPAARVSHRTRIPNLLLTGQNTNSHGALGVLVATIVTCGEILGTQHLLQTIRQAQ